MPAKISGSASGSSTCAEHLARRASPCPRRGLDDLGVDAVHADVGVGDDRRHGEDHQRDLTMVKPRPRKARPMAITARLGSARPMLPMLIARNEPRWMWPEPDAERQRDHERDRPIAATLSSGARRSWQHRVPAFSPHELEGVRRSRSRRPPDPRPRRQQALHAEQQRVGDQRQPDRQHAGGDELGVEARLDRREDRRRRVPGSTTIAATVARLIDRHRRRSAGRR